MSGRGQEPSARNGELPNGNSNGFHGSAGALLGSSYGTQVSANVKQVQQVHAFHFYPAMHANAKQALGTPVWLKLKAEERSLILGGLVLAFFAAMQAGGFAIDNTDTLCSPDLSGCSNSTLQVLVPISQQASYWPNFGIFAISPPKALPVLIGVLWSFLKPLVFIPLNVAIGLQNLCGTKRPYNQYNRQLGYEFLLSLAVLALGLIGVAGNVGAAQVSAQNLHSHLIADGVVDSVFLAQWQANTRGLVGAAQPPERDTHYLIMSKLNVVLKKNNEWMAAKLDQREISRWLHNLVLGITSVFVILFNIAGAYLSAMDFWDSKKVDGVKQVVLSAVNFFVLSLFFLRASALHASKTLHGPRHLSWLELAVIGLCMPVGLISMMGASDFLVHYIFNDKVNWAQWIGSFVIAYGATGGLNTGDLYDGCMAYVLMLLKPVLQRLVGYGCYQPLDSIHGRDVEDYLSLSMSRVRALPSAFLGKATDETETPIRTPLSSRHSARPDQSLGLLSGKPYLSKSYKVKREKVNRLRTAYGITAESAIEGGVDGTVTMTPLGQRAMVMAGRLSSASKLELDAAYAEFKKDVIAKHNNDFYSRLLWSPLCCSRQRADAKAAFDARKTNIPRATGAYTAVAMTRSVEKKERSQTRAGVTNGHSASVAGRG